MEINKNPKFKVLMRTESGCSHYIIESNEINQYLRNKRVISIDMMNDNLPMMENPPAPPPKKVIIIPPPEVKVKGLYVDADDYFRSYMRQKFDEEQIPTQYSIIGLLVVVIVLLVYCIIKVS